MNSLQSFYFEKLGYIHGLIFAYRQETVEILNGNDLSNNEKLFHCIIFADNFVCLYLLN